MRPRKKENYHTPELLLWVVTFDLFFVQYLDLLILVSDNDCLTY